MGRVCVVRRGIMLGWERVLRRWASWRELWGGSSVEGVVVFMARRVVGWVGEGVRWMVEKRPV